MRPPPGAAGWAAGRSPSQPPAAVRAGPETQQLGQSTISKVGLRSWLVHRCTCPHRRGPCAVDGTIRPWAALLKPRLLGAESMSNHHSSQPLSCTAPGRWPCCGRGTLGQSGPSRGVPRGCSLATGPPHTLPGPSSTLARQAQQEGGFSCSVMAKRFGSICAMPNHAATSACWAAEWACLQAVGSLFALRQGAVSTHIA